MLKKAVFQSSKCVVPVNLFSAFEHSESVHNEIETNVFDAFLVRYFVAVLLLKFRIASHVYVFEDMSIAFFNPGSGLPRCSVNCFLGFLKLI